ncbi:MAG: LPP leucine zipper domain-containing protein [Kluyvera sp.]|uniref:LPP leucine zipper domain-containing protein n=1 Tax=Kluyvera sp. TaxID=1538228 RepID=UPI003A8C83E2
MKRKLRISTVMVFTTLLLSSCANPEKIDTLAHDIQVLHVKVARLDQDINALRPEIVAAKTAATQVNSRMDDICMQPGSFCYHPPRW